MFGFLKRWFRRQTPDERRLLAICRGDVEQMNRLIAFERSRRPELSERAALRAAITRYEHDQ